MTIAVIYLDAFGFCKCGCGTKTRIAPRSQTNIGWLKGQPIDFASGHAPRQSPVDFIETPETHCWEWCLHLNAYGYAGKGGPASRVIYRELVGPIPEGLDLDHLCRNRSCVNPGHLEPVTHRENMRRARKTHCRQGHPFDDENTRITPTGERRCRACHRAQVRRGKLRRKKQKEYALLMAATARWRELA